MLIQSGAQVNILDQNQSSPLHIAASMASEDVRFSSSSSSFFLNDLTQIVQLLVTHGADLYQVDNTGRTPFHLAVTTGNLRLVQYFLSIDLKLLDLSDAFVEKNKSFLFDFVETFLFSSSFLSLDKIGHR